MENLEGAFISSITTIDDLSEVMQAGISDEDFVEYKEVWKYFLDYVSKFHKLPPLDLIRTTFKEFTPLRIEGAIPSLIVEIRSRTISRKAKQVLAQFLPNIEEQPQETVEKITSEFLNLQPKSSYNLNVTDSAATKRYERYLTAKDVNITDSIPTGWDFFDKKKSFYQRGELIGFVARPFVGKSWSIVWSAATAWKAGHRILFISPELGIDEAERRFDVAAANLSGFPVVLNDLRFGDIGSKENYRKYAEIASKRADFICIDSVAGKKVTPGRLLDLVLKFRPDIVAIDGIGFIGDDNRSSSMWERIYNVCVDLKNIAVANRFSVLTVQQVKPQVPGFRVPGLEDVMYGDGFVQTCDRVVTISYNEGDEKYRDFTVQKDRWTGQQIVDRQVTEFEPNVGRFGKLIGVV